MTSLTPERKNFLYATSVLIGTMVGVGIFGIPFAFSKAGFWVGFGFLIFIGAITLWADFMYGEVVLRTEAKHQVVGYTELYLGPVFKKVIFFSIALGLYSALLAYMVVAGSFLNNILGSFFYVSQETYSILFFVVISILILKGLKSVFWVELSLTTLFVLVILLIFGVGFPKINFANFHSFTPEFWFLPYGIMLFAFAGLSGIPIQRELLRGQENKLKKSILLAFLLTGCLYAIFAFTVLGVSGKVTTPDALSGLFEFLGGKIIVLGSIFGFLAVSTSFLMLGSAFLDVFRLDYHVSKKWAWALVVLPPLVLFLGGVRTFIDIISLSGSVAIGIEGIVLIFVYLKSKSRGDRVPEYSLEMPRWIYYFLILIFSTGIVYALVVK